MDGGCWLVQKGQLKTVLGYGLTIHDKTTNGDHQDE